MAFIDIKVIDKEWLKSLATSGPRNDTDWVSDDLADVLSAFDSTEGWKVCLGEEVDQKIVLDYEPDVVNPELTCPIPLSEDLDVCWSTMNVCWESAAVVKTVDAGESNVEAPVQEVLVQENLTKYKVDASVRLTGENWNRTKVLHQMITVSSWANAMLSLPMDALGDLLGLKDDVRVSKEAALACRLLITSFYLRKELMGRFTSYRRRWFASSWNILEVRPLLHTDEKHLFRVKMKRRRGTHNKYREWLVSVPGLYGRSFPFLPYRPRLRCVHGHLEKWDSRSYPDGSFDDDQAPLVAPARVHAAAHASNLRKRARCAPPKQ